jgi:predicted RNase H-like nuclease
MSDEDGLAGIDGCRAGWLVATTAGVRVSARLDLDDVTLAGVDMPIGLSDGSPRVCDIAARKFLGRGGSSVFPAPPRAILNCADYAAALDVARSATGRGISRQTFHISAKVAEVDRLIQSGVNCCLVEVHPECSFRVLNSGEVLPPKKTVAGLDKRRQLLRHHFDVPTTAPRGAALHDMLDAYAVLWSTMRFVSNEHQVFGDGQVDERGIVMCIVC